MANHRLIKQVRIAELADRKRVLDELADQAKKLKAEYEIDEAEMIALMDAGIEAQGGPVRPGLKTTERRIIEWKEELARRCGPAVVDEIMRTTLPRTYRHLEFFDATGKKIA